MNRTWKIKLWLGTLMTATLIVVSYEVKTLFLSQIPAWFLVIISFLLGNYGSDGILKMALGRRLGRRILLGDFWMEGMWLVQTEQTESSGGPLTSLGIAEISYIGDDMSPNTTIYRPEFIHMGGIDGYYSTSEMVFIKEPNLYCNYFKIPSEKGMSYGISVGRLIKDQGSFFPTRFEGHVILFDDGVFRRQIARKLTRKEIKEAMKTNPKCWRKSIIDNNCAQGPAPSNADKQRA